MVKLPMIGRKLNPRSIDRPSIMFACVDTGIDEYTALFGCYLRPRPIDRARSSVRRALLEPQRRFAIAREKASGLPG